MRYRLLPCLAKAIAKNGVKFLCGLVPGGEVLFEIASDAWQEYREGRQDDGLRAELGELAQAPAAEVQQEAQQAAQAAAAHLPADERQKIVTYLGQVPGMIRRSLRTPADPTGTIVPATLSLRSPEDLLPFLPPSPPRFQAGMRPLAGVDWVLEEPLGVGGFGEVWKARHAHLRSKPPVALKFCLDPAAAAVLRNEAGVLDRLMQHGRRQGIVPLLDAYLNADPPCLVYEYVEGGDLTGVIREMHARGRPTPETANRLLLRLADIIASAHGAEPPIVHDDLKLSNILVRRGPGEELELHVTDFGIGGLAVARAVRQTRQPTNSRQQLLTEAVRGSYTPLYASPQQMARRRGEAPDPRDDIHALGVIWYQLVTGDLTMLRVPADWTDELRIRGLRADMSQLLGACLAARAEKRPPSARILAEELRVLTTPMGKSSPFKPPLRRPEPEPGEHQPPPWYRNRPLIWELLVLVVVVLGILGSVWLTELFHGFSSPGPRPQAEPPGPQVLLPPEKGKPFINSIGMKLVWIEPGSFLMGSPQNEPERFDEVEKQHPVRLTKGFHMGAYLVTQEQWERVMGKDADHSSFLGKDEEEKKKLPVDSVSWDDCQEFCRKLSALEGRKYTLPTEAQWEYACRAGTSTPFWCGDTISSEQANYFGTFSYGKDGKKGEYRQKTTPVDFFKPNPWGLCDMHGNLYQWCSDYYDPKYYDKSPDKDPENTFGSDARVLRGGSWVDFPWFCRAAVRYPLEPPDGRTPRVGCRIALRLD